VNEHTGDNRESSFAPLSISDADFLRLTRFVQSQYGIDLSKKRHLITARMSASLQRAGYSSFTSFIDHLLREKDPAEVQMLLDKLTTNYTFFMRETEHFDFFNKVILPDLVGKRRQQKMLSIWSAGCASGEEPYNLSMYIKDYLGPEANKWDTRILATDISNDALGKAKAGRYLLPDTVPETWKRRYFTKAGENDEYQVTPTIRNNVIFRQFNLMDPIQFRLKFDVIFCRNVMIYFDQETKNALVNRFCGATDPGGYLLIGHSEALGQNPGYRYLAPAIFQKTAPTRI